MSLRQNMQHLWYRFKKFATSRDALMFVVFVMFSALLWWSRNNDNQRQRTMVVTIHYLGLTPDIAFTDSIPQSLKITYTDNDAGLFRSKPTLDIVSIDCTQELESKKNSINFSAGTLLQIVNDQLPQSATALRIEPSSIQAAFTRLDSKTVPVTFCGTMQAALQYQLENNMSLYPASVTIYGFPSTIDTIQEVKTVEENIIDVKEQVTREIALQSIEGVTFSQSTVELKVSAFAFTETSATLLVQVINAPAQTDIKVFPAEVNVKMQMSIDNYRKFKESDIRAFVNYEDMLKSANGMTKVYISTETIHIFNVKVYPENIEFIIEELE